MTTLQKKHQRQEQQQHQQQDPLLLMLHNRRSLHHPPSSVASSSSSSSAFASPARSGQQLQNNNNSNRKKLLRSFLKVPPSPSSSSSPRAISPSSPRSSEIPQNRHNSKNIQLNQRLITHRNPEQLPSAEVHRARQDNSVNYSFREPTKHSELLNSNPSQLRKLPEKSNSLQNQLRESVEDPSPDTSTVPSLARLPRHPDEANSKSKHLRTTSFRNANNDQSCGNTHNPNPNTRELHEHQQQQQQLNKKSVITRSQCLQEHEDMDSSKRTGTMRDTGPNLKRMKLQDLNFHEASVSPRLHPKQQIASRRLSENTANGPHGPHRRSSDIITQYGSSPSAPSVISDEAHKPSKKRKLCTVAEPDALNATVRRDRELRHRRLLPTTTGESKPFKDSTAASNSQSECRSQPGPEKSLLSGILDKLQKKDKFGVFAQPVDADEVPSYYDIIKDPMDFGTMRKRIESGYYTSLHPFQKDIFTICNNAMTFNAKGTVYYRHARSIKDVAEKILDELGIPRSTSQKDDIPLKSESENIRKPVNENPPKPASKVNNSIPESLNEVFQQKPDEIPQQPFDEIPPESTYDTLPESLDSDEPVDEITPKPSEEILQKSSASKKLSSEDEEMSGNSENEDLDPRVSVPSEDEGLCENASFSVPIESSARNAERHSSSSASEDRVDNQADASGYCSRGTISSDSKVLDGNLRNSYVSVDESKEVSPLVTILSDECPEVIPVWCQMDFPYAKSLARFAADLGPLVWIYAAEKIKLALPPGEQFGPGWVGEKDYPSATSPSSSKQTDEREAPLIVDSWKSQLQGISVDKGLNENQPLVSSKSPPVQSQHSLIYQQSTNKLDNEDNLHPNRNKPSVVDSSDSIHKENQKIPGIKSQKQSRVSSPVNLNQPASDNAVIIPNSEKEISEKGHVPNIASGLSSASQNWMCSVANQLPNSVSKPSGNVDNNPTRGNLNMSVTSPSMHLPFGSSALTSHSSIKMSDVNKSFSDGAHKGNQNISILKDNVLYQQGNKSHIAVTSLNVNPDGQTGSKDTDVSSQNAMMNSTMRPMFLHNLNVPASQVSPRQTNGHLDFDKGSVPNNLILSANKETSTREAQAGTLKQASSSVSDSIFHGNVNYPQGSQTGHNLNLPSQYMPGIHGYNGAHMTNRANDTSQSSVGLFHAHANISQRVQHGDAKAVQESQHFHNNAVYPNQQNNKAGEREVMGAELLQSKYASPPQSERMRYEGQNSLLNYNNLNSPAHRNSLIVGQDLKSGDLTHPKHVFSQDPETVNTDISSINRSTNLNHTLSRFSNEAGNRDLNRTESKQATLPPSQHDTGNSSKRFISNQNLILSNHSFTSGSHSGRNEPESVHPGSHQSLFSNSNQDSTVKAAQFPFSYSNNGKYNRSATPSNTLNSPSGSQMDNSAGLLQSRQFQNNSERTLQEVKGVVNHGSTTPGSIVDNGFNARIGNMVMQGFGNGMYKGPNSNDTAQNHVNTDQEAQRSKPSTLFGNGDAGARDNQSMAPGWLPIKQPDLIKLQNTVSQTPAEGQRYESILNTQRHFSKASVENSQQELSHKQQNQVTSSSVQTLSSQIRQNPVQDQNILQMKSLGNQKNLQSTVPHFLQPHLIQNHQMQMRIQSSPMPTPAWYIGNSEPRDLHKMNQMMQMAGHPIVGLQQSGNMPWQYMAQRMTQQGSQLPYSGAPDLNVSLPSNRSPYEQSNSNEVQQPDLALQL